CLCPGDLRGVPSFPTRRSSDLLGALDRLDDLPERGVAAEAGGPDLQGAGLVDRTGIHRRPRGFLDRQRFAGNRGLINDRVTSGEDRKSTRLNSSHVAISYAVFC